MLNNLLKAAALFMVGIGTGGAFSSYVASTYVPVAHAGPRSKAIISQQAFGKYPAIVIGDSTVELADINKVCGLPALNAGVAGATTAQVNNLAKSIVAGSVP